MQVITIALDLLLFTATALIFSITILCILLYHRVADKYLKGFLGVLFPLMLQMSLIQINTYLIRFGIHLLEHEHGYEIFALFGTFFSIYCSAAILLFVSRYLVALLPIPKKQQHLAYWIINVLTGAYLMACLFAVFLINRGDWLAALDLVLNELFLTGSLLLAAHGIAALFYIKNAENREQENLIRGISVTFLPLIPFYLLDMLFLKEMAFKLTYISFAIFCVNIYLFISRHYIRKYEPEPGHFPERSLPGLQNGGFSKREEEIIRLVIQGKTNKEIGEELFISVNTVKTHIKNIYTKLKVTNRIQLIHKISGFIPSSPDHPSG